MAPQLPLPTPPPSPPQSSEAMSTPPHTSSISNRINHATRKQHTELNRLLIQRLPFALPPHQSTPLLFGKGIVPFARLFSLFETEWDLLGRHAQKLDSADSSHNAQVRRWLASLRPSGLARSERLKNDLQHLRRIAGSGIYSTPAQEEAWTKEMRSQIRQNPEVLVAFAWVFYMATFAGGRWIRQQLANGGVEFWTGQPGIGTLEKGEQSALLQLPGFSFLSFPGEHDGEDIKSAFKSRLAESEDLLTDAEKQEIVKASQQIFEKCISLVTDLDRMVWRSRVLRHMTPIIGVLLLLAFYLVMRYPLRQQFW